MNVYDFYNVKNKHIHKIIENTCKEGLFMSREYQPGS